MGMPFEWNDGLIVNDFAGEKGFLVE